jgi:heme exporter protein D
MTWSEFFHMGGYAVYVWTSYGLALVILLVNVMAPMLRKRRLLRELLRAKARRSP